MDNMDSTRMTPAVKAMMDPCRAEDEKSTTEPMESSVALLNVIYLDQCQTIIVIQ